MAETSIEWANRSWNFLAGCSIVSPGCTNCYAMQMAARIERMSPDLAHYRGLTKPSKAGPVWTGKIGIAEAKLLEPLRVRKPAKWFVNSMSDLFHEDVPDAVIDKAFAVMALCPHHTFQILTKRSARMRDYMAKSAGRIADQVMALRRETGIGKGNPLAPLPHVRLGAQWFPLPNVWLGVSVEDQKRADERIPDLLATPAAVRWISAEPLLGHIELRWLPHADGDPAEDTLGGVIDALGGRVWVDDGVKYFEPVTMHRNGPYVVGLNKIAEWPRLDWVVVGGESGANARPMHPDWARSIRDQCAAADVPFFMKQWGEWFPWGAQPGGDLGGDIRRGQVRIVHPSGRDDVGIYETSGGRSTEPGSRYMAKLGKARAGRMLDGREHNEFPSPHREG